MNQTAAELYERYGDYFHYAKVQGAVENAMLESDVTVSQSNTASAASPLVDLGMRKLPILHDADNNFEVTDTG